MQAILVWNYELLALLLVVRVSAITRAAWQKSSGASSFDDGYDEDAAAHNDPLSPRVLMMEDCSGSTFVQYVAIELLKAHGVNIHYSDYEILKPAKNPAYRRHPENGMSGAMEHIFERAKKNGGTPVFKGEPAHFEKDPALTQMMVNHHTYVVHVYRNNVLDQAVCNVRDCFKTDGLLRGCYPVDDTGKRSHACFKRRFSDSVVEKAHLNVSGAVEWMQKSIDDNRALPGMIAKWGFPRAQTVTYEHLSAFQYTATPASYELSPGQCDFECSVREWCRLLVSWHVDADPRIVRRYLVEFISSGDAYGAPDPHAELIDNLGELRAAFSAAGPDFLHMIRESSSI